MKPSRGTALKKAMLATWVTLTLCACQREPVQGPPPLRPLLYTESEAPATYVDPAAADPAAWKSDFPTANATLVAASSLRAPCYRADELLQIVFTALVSDRGEALEAHIPSVDEMIQVMRVGPERAESMRQELREELREFAALFSPGSLIDARAANLAQTLRPGQLTLGRPRSLGGSIVENPEDAEMHWGSELDFAMQGENANFTLRFPRIVKTSEGRWRIVEVPRADIRYRQWRRLGLHLSPTLNQPEHSFWPIATGNYWNYREEVVGHSSDDGEEVVQQTRLFREDVVDVREFNGWRLIRIVRNHIGGESERPYHYLQTPRQVYSCPRECVRRIQDLHWILAWTRNEAPIMVSPAEPGGRWGDAGVPQERNAYLIDSSLHTIDTEAGNFADTLGIIQQRRPATFYFKPGIGFVRREQRLANRRVHTDLTSFRLMP